MTRKRAKHAVAHAAKPAGKAEGRRTAEFGVRRGATPGTAPAAAFRPGAREALALLLLFAAVWAVTANAMSGEFVLDDTSKIVANTDIRQWAELPSKLIYPYQENQLLERNDPSRPLVFLIYGVVYHFFGLNPVAYHAVNAVFHFASAALVFLLAQLMLWYLLGERKLTAPLLVALFFLVTPIQVGTAIYAYALNDVLSSFLMLASVYCFVRVPRPRALDVAFSLLAMALALFTKQSAVVIPVLVLAFDFFIVCGMSAPALRARLRLYVPYLFLLAIYFVYRFWYFGALGDIEGRGNTHPALAYFFTQPVVILKYLFSSVVPYHLAIDHYLLPGSFAAGTKALAMVALLLLVVPVYYLWRKPTPAGRYALFAICFYFVVLAPTSSVMPTVDVMVERRAYLANAGLFMLMVLGWDRLGKVDLFSSGVSRISLALVGVQLAALAGVSVYRNGICSTNEGVWQDVLTIYPASERAINNLGNVYLGRKEYEKAKWCFDQLVARNPKDYIAQQNLGSIHEREDSPYHDPEKAIGYFKASVAANPDFAEGYYNLGRLCQKTAQAKRDASLMDEAITCYRRTLQLNPSHVLAHNNLGLVYFHQGKAAEARKEYETALRLDPNCEPAKANLKLLDAPPSGPADARSVPLDQIPRDMLLQLYQEALKRDPNNKAIRQKYDELMQKQPPK
jgi:protein O-mannosyl-transferase